MLVTPVPKLVFESGGGFLVAPDTEYMSLQQLAFFQGLLYAERDTLIRAANETTAHLHEFEATPDPSDRASLEEDHSLELRVRDRERKHLHTIDEVLLRIEDGSYGWCEETGEAIGIPRLLARPTATLSLEAQERHESRRRLQTR
ncbi:RNA polymerase-binding protein DksA [Uliginosibacterium gangwonense]|uniref:RNA polymerase-binding protein DksA n=1 Tax=Uliginosibacterium gangwonense TaxID=392736 RepID=UPI00036A170B|nr:RNA polymerase-binding protein DksA [Uliginosibacterium gangwonense]